MSRRTTGIALVAVLLIAGLGVGGYFLGESKAPTAADAAEEREAAFTEASESAAERTAEASLRRGEREGLTEGRKRGQRAGAQAGKRAGEATAGEELAAIEAQEAAEAQAAAEAEEQAALEATQERVDNCGAPLFVEGYCPTDEEVARESAAESLCGPGTAEGRAEAAEQGIEC